MSKEPDHVVRLDRRSRDDLADRVAKPLQSTNDKLESINRKLDEIDNDIANLEQRLHGVEDLDKRVKELEREINRIERTKARAERDSLGDLRETLSEQLEEKREEFQRRLGNVLDDYRESVETLKERFIDSITGRTNSFDQVEEEFLTAQEHREDCSDTTKVTGGQMANTHERRRKAMATSRDQFTGAINDFVEDREDTARTIERLQTRISGVDGATQIVVPFWVVGVRKNGQEEISVLPILDVGESTMNFNRGNPYQNDLQFHQTHNYEAMRDAVHSYVSRDRVRNQLAKQEGTFTDPSFLSRENRAMDRFVNALRQFELQNRKTNGADGTQHRGTQQTKEKVMADD